MPMPTAPAGGSQQVDVVQSHGQFLQNVEMEKWQECQTQPGQKPMLSRQVLEALMAREQARGMTSQPALWGTVDGSRISATVPEVMKAQRAGATALKKAGACPL
ncbi:unnamed protein product [Symbiodinium natans]|uniref:Uncharacterized protein n=1 Tax=Symbiodinium natans TaxID=878477 RepID=A0A812Q1R2_9DINO|nr:unnamed protein product [Symbiodinium natans]